MVNAKNIVLADGTIYENGTFDVPISFLGEFVKLDLPSGETEYISKDIIMAFTIDNKKAKVIPMLRK